MNKRIKELIKQSGIEIRGYYDENGSTPAELQKFTDLIIAECGLIVDELAGGGQMGNAPSYYLNKHFK